MGFLNFIQEDVVLGFRDLVVVSVGQGRGGGFFFRLVVSKNQRVFRLGVKQSQGLGEGQVEKIGGFWVIEAQGFVSVFIGSWIISDVFQKVFSGAYYVLFLGVVGRGCFVIVFILVLYICFYYFVFYQSLFVLGFFVYWILSSFDF